MAKSFKKLVNKTGNKTTKKIAKKRTKQLLKTIQPKSESFAINETGLMLYLYGAGDKADRYIRMDFKDYAHGDDFIMVLDRKTLKGMADFIYKYLENK